MVICLVLLETMTSHTRLTSLHGHVSSIFNNTKWLIQANVNVIPGPREEAIVIQNTTHGVKMSQQTTSTQLLQPQRVNSSTNTLTLTQPTTVGASSSTDPHFTQYGHLTDSVLPVSKLEDKYIIYRCTYFCGGLADRQKGIVTAYIISQILRRKFGLIMTMGCEFSNYVVPNVVNWIVDPAALKGKSTEVKRLIDNSRFGKTLKDGKLEDIFSKDVTYYEGNINLVVPLMNKEAFLSLPWINNLTMPDIYKTAFAQLFKFASSTQKRYETFRARLRNRRLVCAHLRMGKSKTIPADGSRTGKGRPDPKALITFLKAKITPSDIVFIATDSDEVREVFRVVFSDMLIELEGKIVHIDRSGKKFDCSGMEKAILDEYVLSTCDTLVVSNSGFSTVATYIRGTDDNLYRALDTTISNITRGQR